VTPAGGSGVSAAPGHRSAGWRRYVYGFIAGEFSAFTRYYDRVIQWQPQPHDTGVLLERIAAPVKEVVPEPDGLPDLSGEHALRTAVLLNGNLNYSFDILGLLARLKGHLGRTSRVLLVLYNPYLGWLYRAANRLGIRKGEAPTTFVTRVVLEELVGLAGLQVVHARPAVYVPWRLGGLASVINRVLVAVPLLRWTSFTYLVVLRPVVGMAGPRPSLSVIIPARNERDNIEAAVARLPDLGCEVEVVLVEGHSVDGTWDEIRRVAEAHGATRRIVTLQQTGTGKADAVRLGFSRACGDLLVVLDADLTVPPEQLGQFYEAYLDGHADFVNGSRLVYPMEGDAMRAFNRVGNIFFAKALSWVLDTRLTDTLCGTKLFARHDYARMAAWRRDFGTFDPFGDFDMLFSACTLRLGIVDVPIRYQARRYGRTNIQRFRHGARLLRMTWAGLSHIKMGPRRGSAG
jgi:Glycosyl transferase family 2